MCSNLDRLPKITTVAIIQSRLGAIDANPSQLAISQDFATAEIMNPP